LPPNGRAVFLRSRKMHQPAECEPQRRVPLFNGCLRKWRKSLASATAQMVTATAQIDSGTYGKSALVTSWDRSGGSSWPGSCRDVTTSHHRQESAGTESTCESLHNARKRKTKKRDQVQKSDAGSHGAARKMRPTKEKSWMKPELSTGYKIAGGRSSCSIRGRVRAAAAALSACMLGIA